jgi:hypothetical protein
LTPLETFFNSPGEAPSITYGLDFSILLILLPLWPILSLSQEKQEILLCPIL